MPAINDVKTIRFQDFGDERGGLVVVEGGGDWGRAGDMQGIAGRDAPLCGTVRNDGAIPFEIKRVFYIYGSDSDVVRGQHANRITDFMLINVSGTSKVKIIDGSGCSCVVELNEPNYGVYIPHMLWKEMYDFSADSVLLVLASTHYDGSEYIRGFDEFLTAVAQGDTASERLTGDCGGGPQ